MQNLKKWLMKRKEAFGGEAEAFGITPPKGILLTGIPGCGKSLAAKAVAHEWGFPLLRLDPSRLYDKFIGGSEENLLKALQTADAMAPCVLFIDEFEKGFSYSQSSESDAGLSRRLFGSFLTWMQERKRPVFLFATSNDISVLPPELLRKGRFDEIFFVDLPTVEMRKEIWALHLTKRRRDPRQFDLEALVQATEGFSGAEIEQVLVNALYSAFSAHQELTTAQILEEARSTLPLSVTMKERVAALREWAQRRAVFA
jgi:SpoVK/Ycf46/Vps4 family AAA+-type ATPase